MGKSSKVQVKKTPWLVQSKLPVNQLEVRLPVSNWPPRLPGNLLLPPEVSRSPIVIALVRSLFVRSVVTKSRPSSSSASCPSSVWSGKLPKISRPIFVSNRLLLELSRKHLRLTSLACSRIPTCVQSTPSVLPLCPRTSSWLVVSVANVLRSWSRLKRKRPLTDLHYYMYLSIFCTTPRIQFFHL